MTKTEQREFSHQGRAVCIEGSRRQCLVRIDGKLVWDVRHFPSLHAARIAARDYINRHAAA